MTGQHFGDLALAKRRRDRCARRQRARLDVQRRVDERGSLRDTRIVRIAVTVALSVFLGCSGGSGSSSDAAVDSFNGWFDAPQGLAEYAVVESTLEIRSDIGKTGVATVHIMNTGSTALSFQLQIAGEMKQYVLPQVFTSYGCSSVAPGEICSGEVQFLPTSAGDRMTTLTIHPAGTSLPDATVPVLGRTFTRVSVHDFSGPTAGAVTASSSDVSCTQTSPRCSGHFLGDLTLTATPAADHVFVGWTETSCGSSPTCVVAAGTATRQIAASFAPAYPGQLTVDINGAPAGALVRVSDESNLGQSVLAMCASDCTVPLPTQVMPAPQIRISVYSPRGSSTISGACTGTDTCAFAAQSSASVTVGWTYAPELASTVVFDMGPLRSVARGTNGELFVSTISSGSADTWTMKLDTSGKVVWAYPITGSLQPTGDGGVAVSLSGHRVDVLDMNGYPIRRDENQDVTATDLLNIESRHFARMLAIGPNQLIATPGTKSGMSALEAWGPMTHWSAQSTGTGARSITSNGAGTFYVAAVTASDGVAATKFNSSGSNVGTIPGVAQAVPLVMAVSSGGDVVTTSGTNDEVILRRVSPTGQLLFNRAITLSSGVPNRAGVATLSNDDALWIHGAVGQSVSESPTGFVVERVAPNGSVLWSMTQPLQPGSLGVEVYDLTAGGTGAIAVGAFSNPGLGTEGEVGSVVGQSWVGVFTP
jgi:hypothetical protein